MPSMLYITLLMQCFFLVCIDTSFGWKGAEAGECLGSNEGHWEQERLVGERQQKLAWQLVAFSQYN